MKKKSTNILSIIMFASTKNGQQIIAQFLFGL